MTNLAALTWPASKLGEAVELLGRHSNLLSKVSKAPSPLNNVIVTDKDALSQWLETMAAGLGLELEPVYTYYPDVKTFISNAGPALLRVPGQNNNQFLLLLSGDRRNISILTPRLTIQRVSLEKVRAVLCHQAEAVITDEIERLLNHIDVPKQRRTRTRTAIFKERLQTTRIEDCWLLRLPPGANVLKQAQHANLPKYILAFMGMHSLQYLLWIVSWWVVGRAVLQTGVVDLGWLWAWTLLLVTLIPFRLLATWLQGLFAVEAGIRLKQRFLQGALHFKPDEIRHQGVGQLLGRVIESEAVEFLALSGGFLALVALLELAIAMFILSVGAGGWPHAFLLFVWLGLTAGIVWRHFRQRHHWTKTRLTMTHDLVEGMVGHRTRLAQEQPETWHQNEDQLLEQYLSQSGTMDRSGALIMALVPHGWLVVGLIGLTPAFVAGQRSIVGLAIGLGATLLAYKALSNLSQGLLHVVGAVVAWQHVAPLFWAAARSTTKSTSALPVLSASNNQSSGWQQPVIDARDLTFRYRDRGDPVLQGCNFRIYPQERILLEGPSGGGKSTLASILMGLRLPESGLLLLQGLDWHTLGHMGWGRRVVAAPQFHENHILTETFAFNLLMGRRWPPRREDMQDAQIICRELGLGNLLDRMPAGMLQMVGETGWQLSHGERSRLYIARTLLQNTDLVILDESFAALDPENLQRALHCVLNRASTLVVIAHP